MLSYEEFKEKLVTEVTVYAPEKYKNAIVDIMGVPKAEGNVDAIIMRMPDRNSGASLNCKDLYADYVKSNSFAHNVFAWNSRTSPTPHELSRLGYPWLEVALNAIFISGGNMKVQIQENEKGIPELLLDVSSYEKTKQFHERFQQMQNDLDDEFDEEMEQ